MSAAPNHQPTRGPWPPTTNPIDNQPSFIETISRRLGRRRRRCRIARDSGQPRRSRVSSSGHQSFEEPLDTLSTTPGRRSPGPFCGDRGGSTFA
jgi:hypothetical protein